MIDPNCNAARPVAILRVTSAMLIDLLKLPPDTKIVDISPHLFFSTDEIAVKIEHPDFPLISPTQNIPQRVPHYRERRVAEFAGWEER